ncbi:MAG: hypothetical protein R3A80_09195 [Bdellovibrionota bacterium]
MISKFWSISFLLTLGACSFFHTKASLKKSKEPLVQKKESQPLAEKDMLKVESNVYVYSATSIEKLSIAFDEVLRQEDFQVKEHSPGATQITAESTSKDSLALFNSDFSTGRNYKVSESLVVDVMLSKVSSGVEAKLILTHLEKYSMGQVESRIENDLDFCRRLFSKVNLAL